MSYFTSPQETFNRSAGIAQGIGNAYGGQKQNNAIEKILSDAQTSGDPQVLQQSIGKILSKVAPERQEAAIKVIQGIAQNMQQKKQGDAWEKHGGDRNLPESGNLQLMKNQNAQNDKYATVPSEVAQRHSQNLAELALPGNQEKYKTPQQKAAFLAEKGSTPDQAAEQLKAQRPYESTPEKLAATEASEYSKKIRTAGENADKTLNSYAIARENLSSTGVNPQNLFAEMTGLEGWKDPSSELFKASVKGDFRGIGDLVKGKVSNMEWTTYEGMIPSVLKSPRANEALITMREGEMKIAQKERDIEAWIRESTGGFPQYGQEDMVKRLLRPEADKIWQDVIKKTADIIQNPTVKQQIAQQKKEQIENVPNDSVLMDSPADENGVRIRGYVKKTDANRLRDKGYRLIPMVGK